METEKKPRRPKGHPKPYQRSYDGRYCVRYKGKTISDKTEKGCLEKLRDLQIAEAKGERLNNPANRTVGDLLDEWLSVKLATQRTYSTYVNRECNIRKHLKPALGKIKLTELTTLQVEKFLISLAAPKPKGKGLSENSIRSIRAALVTALNQGKRWKWNASNPAEDAEIPVTTPPKALPRFKEDQGRQLLEAFQSFPACEILETALWSGCRPSELCGLRRKDIHFDKATARPTGFDITCQFQYQKRAGDEVRQPYLVPPKTKYSIRHVDIPDEAADAILGAIDRSTRVWAELIQKDALLPNAQFAMEHGLVFVTELGTPMNVDTTLYRIKRCLENADMEPLTPHKLRHLFATGLIDSKEVSINDVAGALGHSTPGITLRVYARPTEGSTRRVANVTGTLFKKTSQ